MLQFGISPTYVLDQIEIYEISALFKFSHYRFKESWEQARLVSYLIAQTHSSKKIKLEDIIKFRWDQQTPKDTQISKEDIARLSAQAAEFEKLFAQQ